MIGWLEGRPLQLEPGSLILVVGGVGYQVATTLRSWESVGGAEQATLWIHTHVREDAFVLYGFPTREELTAFQRLIAISGVGPRLAVAVLSALTPADLAEAVSSSDIRRLQRTPGIGRKTAERIVLELRGRLDDVGVGVAFGGGVADAVSALVNLGYSEREASRAVEAVRADAGGDDLGTLLRLALKKLTA